MLVEKHTVSTIGSDLFSGVAPKLTAFPRARQFPTGSNTGRAFALGGASFQVPSPNRVSLLAERHPFPTSCDVGRDFCFANPTNAQRAGAAVVSPWTVQNQGFVSSSDVRGLAGDGRVGQKKRR